MNRSARSIVFAAVAILVLLALSLVLRSWGGLALAVVCGAGFAWYRVQVARSEAGEQFFGDMGDETRLTGFQGGSASEMPLDRTMPDRPAREPDGQ